jgi:hypothetical protein
MPGYDYGWPHRRLRARINRQVQAGNAVCWRCGLPIEPGSPWHLGHDDIDRSIYRGAEHAGCNLAAAGRANRCEPIGCRSRVW